MLARQGTLCLAAAALAALGLTAVPQSAVAQKTKGDTDTSSTELMNKPIDLDVESANLYSALNMLFQHTKANFTLDPSLKQLKVTAHFHQVLFRIALETLLKASGQPLTYRFENDIYSVVPKVEKAEDLGGILPKDDDRGISKHHPPVKFRGDQLIGNAIDLVSFLGGKVLNADRPASLGVGGRGGFGQSGFGNSAGNGQNGNGTGTGGGFPNNGGTNGGSRSGGNNGGPGGGNRPGF